METVNREHYPVRLMVIDIDGCLSPGLFQPFDLGNLQKLADCNKQSKTNPLYPPVTICTGRPEPYAEAILQLLGAYYPAICEHGGILCSVNPPVMEINPKLPAELPDELLRLKHHLYAAKKNGTDFMLEPGKETHCTVFVKPPSTMESLHSILSEIMTKGNLPFLIKPGRECFNIFPHILHKGMGIEWLAEQSGIPAETMAGVGDSDNDVPFLEKVGFPSTVSNGSEKTKQVKNCYISKLRDIEGVLDFYHYCVELNKKS